MPRLEDCSNLAQLSDAIDQARIAAPGFAGWASWDSSTLAAQGKAAVPAPAAKPVLATVATSQAIGAGALMGVLVVGLVGALGGLVLAFFLAGLTGFESDLWLLLPIFLGIYLGSAVYRQVKARIKRRGSTSGNRP